MLKILEVSSLLYKVTCNNTSWSWSILLQRLDTILRALRDILSYYLLFSILFTFPQKKKRESYYCQSQVKLKWSSVLWGLVRFSIWFICTQCIISRVFYASALCVSRTINPARITNVHFIDFWSFPQREQDKETERKRNRKKT